MREMMICPKAKECIGKCPNPLHQTPHEYQDGFNDRCDETSGGCPSCIPCIPEQEYECTHPEKDQDWLPCEECDIKEDYAPEPCPFRQPKKPATCPECGHPAHEGLFCLVDLVNCRCDRTKAPADLKPAEPQAEMPLIEGTWEYLPDHDNEPCDSMEEINSAGTILYNNWNLARIWLDCPNAEELAKFIIKACNSYDPAHDQQVRQAAVKEFAEKVQKYIDDNNVYQVVFEHYEGIKWIPIQTKKVNIKEALTAYENPTKSK
jgi:hypothetical protein